MRFLVFSCASEGGRSGPSKAVHGRGVASRCQPAHEAFPGEIVGVDGVVAQSAPLAVEFRGGPYDEFSDDAESRQRRRIDF